MAEQALIVDEQIIQGPTPEELFQSWRSPFNDLGKRKVVEFLLVTGTVVKMKVTKLIQSEPTATLCEIVGINVVNGNTTTVKCYNLNTRNCGAITETLRGTATMTVTQVPS